MAGEGYLAQRSSHRGMIVPVMALHGAVIAALMLSPAKEWIKDPFEPLVTIDVPLPPPPTIAPPKTKVHAQPKFDQPPRPMAYIKPTSGPDASTDVTGETGTVMGGDGVGEIEVPIVEPVTDPITPPVIVGIKDDARFVRDLQPPYPPGMARAEIEGAVTVRVLVGIDGRVKAVEAVRVDQEDFLKATRDWALRKWRFKPATRDGVPYEDWVVKKVRFELNQ